MRPARAARGRAAVLIGWAIVATTAAGCSDGDPPDVDARDESGSGTPVRDSGGTESGSADEGIDGVVTLRVSGNAHDESPIAYEHVPPAGGTHNPVWQNCGRYVEPQPDGAVVHSLEHGAVWLAYRPDLGEAAGEALAASVARSDKVVISPRDGLGPGVAVVATAWARQLRVESVDDARLAAFVDAYLDAPWAPEPGGSCSGGRGRPE